MTEIESLLRRSRKYLASARALVALGDQESAVSRAYYAMFFAVEALLLRDGQALPLPWLVLLHQPGQFRPWANQAHLPF